MADGPAPICRGTSRAAAAVEVANMRDDERAIREVMDRLSREGSEERQHPEADVTPEPAPTLDDTDAAPLTDSSDVKGG